MFISRKRYDRLTHRLDVLETYAHRDYERLKNQGNQLSDLQKTVGDTESRSGLSMLMERYYGCKPEPKISLSEKIEQIMAHVGLEVRHTRESVKLAKKPEPKAKATPKGKK